MAPDGLLATQARLPDKPHAYLIRSAGERDAMRAIGPHFHHVAGLSKEQVLVAGYWTRGVSNTEIDQRRGQSVGQLIANDSKP